MNPGSAPGNIHISSPWNSPNTDGIHIGHSSNINITSSRIGVGDDCVSIGPGSTNIAISGVYCGPGHGISIGSLGKYERETDVVGVTVKNCTFNGTTNGVRIKTWPGAVAMKAKNITFENIRMVNVSNPIIIDQKYCPGHGCDSDVSSVQISNVVFKNFTGTSRTHISLYCSPIFPCKNVELKDINITYANTSTAAEFKCSNINAADFSLQKPFSCSTTI